MSTKHKKLTERSETISILALLLVSSVLTFIQPLKVVYLSDLYVSLGMLAGCFIILKMDKEFHERIKSTIILILAGGVLTGLELTGLILSLAYANNLVAEDPLKLLVLWIGYIYLTLVIIGTDFILALYLGENTYFKHQ